MNRDKNDSLFKREKYTLIVVLFLIASAISIYSLVTIVKHQYQVAFADTHIDIFEMMVEKSRESNDPNKVIRYLKYTINHYPAGTIQTKGSHLDNITEISRKMAVELIIEELKRTTGKNLGYDPQNWLDHYRSDHAP